MRKVGHPFYSSARWKKTRSKYLEVVHYVCERCGRPATQVHHKEHLTEEDYFFNLEKCYGFDNLEALCLDCHNRQEGHFLGHLGRQAIADGYRVDMITGDVVPISPQGVGCDDAKKSR